MDWFPPSVQADSSYAKWLGGIWCLYSGHRPHNQTLFVWLHGWGQSHASFRPMVEQLNEEADHLLIDFPGFGFTPLIADTWGTEDYAKAIQPIIATYQHDYKRIIFISHSFGCRVSLRYVNAYPNTIDGLIVLGGAGLQRRLNLKQRLRRIMIRCLLNTGKTLDKYLPTRCADWARKRFGSRDYLAAGVLRPILSRTVSEDLSEHAKQTAIPVLLLYGENDQEAPPEFGERFHSLMPRSTLHILPNFDHYSILSHARYQVVQHINEWLKHCHTDAIS